MGLFDISLTIFILLAIFILVYCRITHQTLSDLIKGAIEFLKEQKEVKK